MRRQDTILIFSDHDPARLSPIEASEKSIRGSLQVWRQKGAPMLKGRPSISQTLGMQAKIPCTKRQSSLGRNNGTYFAQSLKSLSSGPVNTCMQEQHEKKQQTNTETLKEFEKAKSFPGTKCKSSISCTETCHKRARCLSLCGKGCLASRNSNTCVKAAKDSSSIAWKRDELNSFAPKLKKKTSGLV